MATSYSEKLKDPRWQKKRLEVFQRDNFTCKFCGDTTSTLHVHHLYYFKEPWDANMRALITLCASCHDEETSMSKDAEVVLNIILRHEGFGSVYLIYLSMALAKYKDDANALDVINCLAVILSDKNLFNDIKNKFNEEIHGYRPLG